MIQFILADLPEGTKTIDEIHRVNFATYKAFKARLNELVNEYRNQGLPAYLSSRRAR